MTTPGNLTSLSDQIRTAMIEAEQVKDHGNGVRESRLTLTKAGDRGARRRVRTVEDDLWSQRDADPQLRVEHRREAPRREQLRQHEGRKLDDATAGIERQHGETHGVVAPIRCADICGRR